MIHLSQGGNGRTATSMVVTLHRRAYSLSVDLRPDEISATGGRRLFAPLKTTPISAGYLLSSGRDVPIDRFSHPSFPFFEAAPTGAVFSMQKRTRSVLSELRRTHNMHDWTLSGTDHPAVHFNVEQKGKGSSLCSTFFPSQQFFSFFFSMPLIKVFLSSFGL